MSRPQTGITVPVRVISSIQDGDTVEVKSYSGFRWRIRLIGCWCAEKNTERGKRADAYVRETLDDAQGVYAFVPFPETIEHEESFNPLDLATFNRVPGYLYVGDRDLGSLIRRAGHGYMTKAELKAVEAKDKETSRTP